MGRIIIETPLDEDYKFEIDSADVAINFIKKLAKLKKVSHDKNETPKKKKALEKYVQSLRDVSRAFYEGENLELPTTANLIEMDEGREYTPEELKRVESGERFLKILDRADAYGAFDDETPNDK